MKKEEAMAATVTYKIKGVLSDEINVGEIVYLVSADKYLSLTRKFAPCDRTIKGILVPEPESRTGVRTVMTEG